MSAASSGPATEKGAVHILEDAEIYLKKNWNLQYGSDSRKVKNNYWRLSSDAPFFLLSGATEAKYQNFLQRHAP